jgi:hypothetical protein
MYKDEIIKDVWRNRDEYVKEHKNNLAEIVHDLQKREKARTNVKIVDRRNKIAMP